MVQARRGVLLARRLAFLAGLVAALGAATPPAEAAQPKTIPALREWTDGTGSYTFGAESRIVLDATSAAGLSTTASVLADDLLTLTGLTVPLITGAASVQAGDIYLSLSGPDPELGEEGYLLTITDSVAISAPTDAGVFYGTRSLLQMLRQGFQIPAGTARDWPDYPERGMMVDTGRKFFPVEFIERHIKELAYLKLNYFHLHLSDQDVYGGYGFRLESLTHPEITSAEHYSTAELQSLLALAEAYHVMIVPEIDVPSHALPLLAPHPDLQLPGTTGKVDLSNPDSYVLIQDLLDEFLPQFPAPYWHTGGDEYLHQGEYANYPQLQTYAQQRYGPGANGQDLYIGFVNWVDDIVRAHGKHLRAWNDVYGVTGNINTPNSDIILEMWYPYISPQEALDRGHTIMNCSLLTLYYVLGGDGLTNDPANTINLYESWAPHLQFPDSSVSWPGNISLTALTPGLRGGKFHIWCDYPDAQTEEQVQKGIVNHLRGLAQNSWGSPKLVSTYQLFEPIIDLVGHTPDYGPDFTLTAATAGATITAGNKATYSLQLTPLMGFNEATTLSCTLDAPASVCSVTPSNVVPSGTPASPSAITVSVSTSPMSSAATFSEWPQPRLPLGYLCFGLIIVGIILRTRQIYTGRTCSAVVALAPLLLLGLLLIASCGSSAMTTVQPIRTPAGNYTVTLFASSSTINHRVNLSLTVR